MKAEVDIATSLLAVGGNLVVKMYTMFRAETVELIAHLMAVFEQVHLYKPSCSKPGNSEVSIVHYYNNKSLQCFLGADVTRLNFFCSKNAEILGFGGSQIFQARVCL